jgi:hypothetical protein
MAVSPVRVITPAGPIGLRLERGLEGGLEGDAYLTGPAEIIAEGEFFM